MTSAMQVEQFVENGERLVQAMGYWPSFHDANVVDVIRGGDFFSVKIHVFAMTDKVDADGYYVLDKHHLVTFEFRKVQTNSLPSDYTSDCLDRLVFDRSGEMVQAIFESHMGQDGTVVCAEAVITDVLPHVGGGR
jgi:hypothetical protein